MTLANNINNVITELHAVLLNSDLADMVDKPDGIERDAALSMTLGKQGYRPPWPRAAGEAASWEIRQIGKLLRQSSLAWMQDISCRAEAGRYPWWSSR